MPTDLPQKGKIFRCHRKFRQWLNRFKTGELCDMHLVGAKANRGLDGECAPWQEIDCASAPWLTRQSRWADGEDIVGSVQCPRFIGQANTCIGDRLDTVTIDDGKEHRPHAI